TTTRPISLRITTRPSVERRPEGLRATPFSTLHHHSSAITPLQISLSPTYSPAIDRAVVANRAFSFADKPRCMRWVRGSTMVSICQPSQKWHLSCTQQRRHQFIGEQDGSI